MSLFGMYIRILKKLLVIYTKELSALSRQLLFSFYAMLLVNTASKVYAAFLLFLYQYSGPSY